MQVTKYETNLKRKLFLYKTSNKIVEPDIKNEENKLINIYPSIKSHDFMGFGGALTRVYLFQFIYL